MLQSFCDSGMPQEQKNALIFYELNIESYQLKTLSVYGPILTVQEKYHLTLSLN